MKIMKREIIVGCVSAIAFAAAFTGAQLFISYSSCKWVKGTMFNGSPAYVRVDGADAVMLSRVVNGVPSGSTVWTSGDKVLVLNELPEKLLAACWR